MMNKIHGVCVDIPKTVKNKYGVKFDIIFDDSTIEVKPMGVYQDSHIISLSEFKTFRDVRTAIQFVSAIDIANYKNH